MNFRVSLNSVLCRLAISISIKHFAQSISIDTNVFFFLTCAYVIAFCVLCSHYSENVLLNEQNCGRYAIRYILNIENITAHSQTESF